MKKESRERLNMLDNLINKIILDDCFNVLKDISNKSIDLVVTDPPYEFISKNPAGGGLYEKRT